MYATHDVWQDATKVYVSAASWSLEVYLFHRLANLTVIAARYDFTAKMMSTVWILPWGLMTLICLAWFKCAIDFVKRQDTEGRTAEVSSTSESDLVFLTARTDASSGDGLTQPHTGSSASENETWVNLRKESAPRAPDEQQTATLSIPVDFLEAVFVVGILTLPIPLLRLPFA